MNAKTSAIFNKREVKLMCIRENQTLFLRDALRLFHFMF